MADNPIRYSDFIAPDGSISDLLAQLKALRSEYEALGKTISSEAKSLADAMKGMTSATAAGRNGIGAASASADDLADRYNELQAKIKALEAEMARLTAAQQSAASAGAAAAQSADELIDSATRARNALDAQEKSLAENVAALTAVEVRIKALKNNIGDMTKKLSDTSTLTEAQNKQLNEWRTHLATAREEARKLNLEINNQIREGTAAEGSIRQMQESLRKLQRAYIELSAEQRNSDLGRGMQQSISRLNNEVLALESSIGRNQRNVGNYAAAFDNLNLNVQQVAREMPSLAVGFNTFVLAISNNIPMLMEAMKKYRAEMAAMQAQGQKGPGVWKAMLSSLLNWQTALIAGITILSMYGDEILDWVVDLFKGKDALQTLEEAMDSVNEKMAENTDSAGRQIAEFRKLSLEWGKLTTLKERQTWLEKHRDAMHSLGLEVTNVNDADELFIRRSADVTEAFKMRARAAAAMQLAQEKYSEALKKEAEYGGSTKRIREAIKYIGSNGKEQMPTHIKYLTASEWEKAQELYSAGTGYVDRYMLNNYRSGTGKDIDPKNLRGQYVVAAINFLKNKETELNEKIAEGDQYISLVNTAETRADELLGKFKYNGDDDTNTVVRAGRNTSHKTSQPKWKDLTKLLRELAKSRAEIIDDDEQEERAEVTLNYDNRIADYRKQLDEEANLTAEKRRVLNDLIVSMEEEKQKKLSDIDNKYGLKRAEAQKDLLELQLANAGKETEQWISLQTQLLNTQEAIEKAKLPAGTESKAMSDQIAIQYENMRKEAKREWQKYRLEVIEKEGLENFDKQVELAQSDKDFLTKSEKEKTEILKKYEIERMKLRLQYLQSSYNASEGVEQGEIGRQIQVLQGQIAAAEHSLNAPKEYGSMWDLLGISVKDKDGFDITGDITKQIDVVLNSAMEALDTWMQAREEAAERQVELAQKETEAAQSWLDSERQARANGYANEVATARKELEMKKRNEQKALQYQQKIAQQRIAIDSAMQASSMIVASANIWSTFTSMGVFGIPAAIAAIAVMWGSFIASRVKAMQLAKSTGGTESYGEGTVELLQGGSHRSGHDIDLGTKPDGTRRRAEGGEFFAVINRRNSRRYRSVIPDVINSLNDGSFADKYMTAYDTPVMQVSGGASAVNLSRIEGDLRTIRKRGERTAYTDGRGFTVIRYKNLTRRIKS